MYKVEGRGKYGWGDDYVGSDDDCNRFETREEAEALLPTLATNLGCEIDDLRVVQCEG
jgi:hypothetical protein